MRFMNSIRMIGLAIGLFLPALVHGSLNDRLSADLHKAFSVEPWASLDSFSLEIRAFSLNGLPDNARIELEPLRSRRRGVNMQRVRFYGKDGSLLRNLTLSIKVRSWELLPVASLDLKRGDILSASNLSTKLLESTQLGEADCPLTESLYGQRMERHVEEGHPLTDGMCRPVPDVIRGDRLKISLQEGGLEIQLQGRAEKDACVGDPLDVRIDGSGKRLRARLISGNEALLLGDG